MSTRKLRRRSRSVRARLVAKRREPVRPQPATPKRGPAMITNGSHIQQDDADTRFAVRPAHLRLVEAYEQCLQDGQNPTDGVIAKKLDVRRETVTRWRRRRPDLWAWVYGRLGEHALQMRPVVDRRVTQLAIQGSAEHTKLYYQFVAKVGTPLGDDGAPAIGGGVIVNVLVPHPQLPNGGRLPALPAASIAPAQKVPPPTAARALPRDIPTVLVR